MQQVNIGEKVRLRTAWYNVDGDAQEPSAIALTITAPDGTTIAKTKADMVQPVPIPPASDVWIYEQVASQAGVWRWEATGTVGTYTVIESSMFLVGVASRPDGPCEPWCTWDDLAACGNVPTGLDSAQRESILDTASEILWDLSGRIYSGVCTTTRALCLCCETCHNTCCDCLPRERIDLGRTPVHGVWDVIVDGVTVDPSAYRVEDQRYLVRIDDDIWPRCHDLTDPEAFQATWAYGQLVPPAGKQAAARFAREMALSCAGQVCQLPQRVTSVVREGVTFTILDSMQMVEKGRTGVYLVDLWLTADRRGRQTGPRLYAPGGRPVRRARI